MSDPVDARTAWDVVRTLEVSPGSRATRLRMGPSDTWLEVDGAGRWTTSADVAEEVAALLDLYLPLKTRPDVVIGQLGQSVDGRIATEGGASHYVTGTEDLDRLHRLRALVDAVVVGADTVASDDPLLTVRRVEGESPVRVVLDPNGRLDDGRRVFTDGAAPTIVVHGSTPRDGSALTGPEHLAVPATVEGGLDLAYLLRALRERGLGRVLVEGGGITVSRFLQAGLLDRLHVTVAPMLIGSGRPSITLDPVASLDQALRPACRHFRLGSDVLFDFDLRSRSE